MTAHGRFLYPSDRGHDSVVAFGVDPADGRLSPLGCVPSGVRTPRFIGLDPEHHFLYAANEDDDTGSRFDACHIDGSPDDAAVVVRVGSPTYILFRRVG